MKMISKRFDSIRRIGAAHVSECQSNSSRKVGKSVGDGSSSDVRDGDGRRLETVLGVVESDL